MFRLSRFFGKWNRLEGDILEWYSELGEERLWNCLCRLWRWEWWDLFQNLWGLRALRLKLDSGGFAFLRIFLEFWSECPLLYRKVLDGGFDGSNYVVFGDGVWGEVKVCSSERAEVVSFERDSSVRLIKIFD